VSELGVVSEWHISTAIDDSTGANITRKEEKWKAEDNVVGVINEE